VEASKSPPALSSPIWYVKELFFVASGCGALVRNADVLVFGFHWQPSSQISVIAYIKQRWVGMSAVPCCRFARHVYLVSLVV